MAGFKFHVQVEVDRLRARIGKHNFPGSAWLVGPVADVREQVAAEYRSATDQPLDLLVATPPCQGMSSSNPSRGRRKTPMAKRQEHQNSLILEIIPIARSLNPRLIVAENVRQILTLESEYKGREGRVVDVIRQELRDNYSIFEGIVDVANYGIPQTRKRGRRGCDKTRPALSTKSDGGLAGALAPTISRQKALARPPSVDIRPEVDDGCGLPAS